LKEGDMLSLDGTTGEVIKGAIALVQPEMTGNFGKFMGWVDEIRTLGVRTNAETPLDAQTARDFGAEGIGLARTEHMFFDAKRIIHMRQMILSTNEADRRAALEKLLPYQKQDFIDLFTIMKGLPVTVRLLDPPLHEFLPNKAEEQAEVALALGIDVETVKSRTAQLHEANPMLGHRGCRLGITYPEINEMQAQAILEAALEVSEKEGIEVVPDIMIPLVGSKKELDLAKASVEKMAKEVSAKYGKEAKYHIGTMIELPRACVMSGEIAKTAEFFSFGTNDLTQTTLGMSRDDAGSFLPEYAKKGIYERDPFASLDQEGVGSLIKLAVKQGKETRPDIHLGICGEHGGDPRTVEFCHNVGLTYVSCSPYRVPIARLAAAQAEIKNPRKK